MFKLPFGKAYTKGERVLRFEAIVLDERIRIDTQTLFDDLAIETPLAA